jgi:putative Holliday junction resolvase
MQINSGNILALDVGTVRIGLAIASAETRLPRPLVTLSNTENFTEELLAVINNEKVSCLVIGLPRGLDGQETLQTAFVRQFADELDKLVTLPVYFQDEALSSARAKQELEARNKPYVKADVDALAAMFILDDYLLEDRN